MKYTKKPFTKLHHVETTQNDDGTVTVEAHLMHHPPMPKGKDGKDMPGMAMPYAMERDYPNKKFTMTADDPEEAGEHVQAIHEAHQHEKGGKRGRKVEDDADESERVPAGHADDETEND